ncbi:uncharacterized protein LOC122943920 isoform X2 [Bufo gargarizans]|uniref:uncharacterized protein LOC122943920 isoform X2 n=1 Tax=Bufo gargarizans TaxID=30331 RepID=UPI001CF15D65|nr:uncharacterized protein LOC122943920 isoform X2 [Bufo gargarizans]
MKTQDLILAAIICTCIQIADASHYGEFIDPTDMEHYDQRSKSLTFTLKEKASQDILKVFLQRLLKSAQGWDVDIRDENLGVVSTEMEIEKFLNDEDWDSDKLQIILQNVDFIKDKGVDFSTLFLEQASQNILKVFLQRLLKSAQSWDVNIKDEKLGVVSTEMEIQKFLNDEDWDPDKLQIILQNVDFIKDKGVDFSTLFLTCAICCALTWIMNRFWTRPDQNVEENTPNEQVEENCSFPIPDTQQNEHFQNVRCESHSEPAAKQDQLDKHPSQSFQMSDESNKRDTVTFVGTKADSLSNMKNIPELVTTLRDMESTDSPNDHQELSSEAEETSEEKANVDTGLDTSYPQDTSVNADYESDFSLISESAPGSLIFEQDGDSDESV